MSTSLIRPHGQYVAAVVHGETVVSAGMTPRSDEKLVAAGRVENDASTPGTIDVPTAAELAGHAVTRAVRACEEVLPEGATLVRPVSMTVFVRCDGDFTSHSAVADGASKVLDERFGSLPVRAAVGVISLPGGAPVEVQLTLSWAAN
ncbi:RidA family protein [Rhodococcus sp. WS4]|nr:RidA family protein [Rhodococcus sp. WS4]